MLNLDDLQITAGFRRITNRFDKIDDKPLDHISFINQSFENIKLANFAIEMIEQNMFHMALASNSIEELKKWNSTEAYEFESKYQFSVEGVIDSIKEGLSKIWEFIKSVFAKIIEVIKSFFSWIASFFKDGEAEKCEKAAKTKKKKKQNVEKVLKEAGVSKKPEDLTPEDKPEVEQKVQKLIEKKEAKVTNQKTPEAKEEKKKKTEKKAKAIAKAICDGIEMNGVNAKQIFSKDFKSDFSSVKIMMKKIDGYNELSNQIIEKTARMIIDVFKDDKKLNKDREKVIAELKKQFDEAQSEQKTTNILEEMYGKNYKKYKYSFATIVSQTPEVLLFRVTADELKRVTNNLNGKEKYIKTIYDSMKKNDLNDLAHLNESEKKEFVNIVKNAKSSSSQSVKLMISVIKEMTDIRKKALDAYKHLDKFEELCGIERDQVHDYDMAMKKEYGGTKISPLLTD